MDAGSDSSAAAVVADQALLTHIAGFVRGYPHAVALLASGPFKQFQCGRPAEKGVATTLPQLAVVADNVETLRLLYKLKTQPRHRHDPLLSIAGIDRIAILLQRTKMLEFIAELAARDPEWVWEPTLMKFAFQYARSNHCVLDWVFHHLPPTMRVLPTQTSNELVRTGEVDTVRWLVDHGLELSEHAADIAADKKSVDILAYLYEHTTVRCSLRSIRQAVANAADLEVVKIIVRRSVLTQANGEGLLYAAAMRSPLDFVAFLVERGIGVSSKYAINSAAERGRLDIVKYLHAHLPGGCTPEAMNRAAEFGHLNVVQFLHAHRTEGCTTAAMDSAAGMGHLKVVQFLHTHRTEGCTTAAMDKAAAGGHLDVVQFLHKLRSEGCTTAAMDSAAAQGHLEIVAFLHDHRTEGCTTAAMNNAAMNGYLYVVAFLHKYRIEGCTPLAMDRAAGKGHVEIVAYLHKHRREGCTSWAMDSAVTNGHLDVVKFLHKHRSEGYTQAAVDHAAIFGQHEVVEFLRKSESKGRVFMRQMRQWRPSFFRS